MWQTENDLHSRIRDLNSGAGDHYARLVDTLTETDGSADSREPLVDRLMVRVKRAIARIGNGSQPTMSEPACVESTK